MATLQPVGDITDTKIAPPPKNLTEHLNSLVDIFDNGSRIYLSVQERVRALKQIQNETVSEDPERIEAETRPEGGFGSVNQSSLIILGSILIGSLVLVSLIKR